MKELNIGEIKEVRYTIGDNYIDWIIDENWIKENPTFLDDIYLETKMKISDFELELHPEKIELPEEVKLRTPPEYKYVVEKLMKVVTLLMEEGEKRYGTDFPPRMNFACELPKCGNFRTFLIRVRVK